MQKKIGLWVLATLFMAGAAMGTYMYSHGELYDKTAVGNCPFKSSCSVGKTTTLQKVVVSHVTASTDSSKTTCCGKQKVKTDKIDTSTYTLISPVQKSKDKAGIEISN